MDYYRVSDELINSFANKAIRNVQGRYEVTLLVGNGFDIGLGLKTRYSDFLDYYLDQKRPAKTAAIDAMKNEIDRQRYAVPDSWSNAELAFAQLDFSSFPSEDGTIGALAECEGDFTEALVAYLKREDERFYIPQERQVDASQKFISQLFNTLSVAIPKLREARSLNVEVFNFNYTSTLDRLLSVNVASLDKPSGSNLGVNIGRVHHIHGQLSGRNIVFGVDDYDQIEDRYVAAASQRAGYLLKPRLDTILQINELEAFSNRILTSDVIVLFGLSYGLSDMSIWHSLFHAMKKVPLLDLILCEHAESPPTVKGTAMLQKLTFEAQRRFAESMSQFFNFDVSDYANNLHVTGYDYYDSPCGQPVYSDPLGLRWFGQEFVRK